MSTTSLRKHTACSNSYHQLILFHRYTSVNNKLYELDGLQPAPISHGSCSPKEFPNKVIPVLQRRIGRYPATEIRFNLLACVQDQRIRAREIGDMEALEEQEDKRNSWLWENALRRHNFVGFVGELMKGVTKAKLAQGGPAYDKWIEDAKAKTKKRMEDRRKQGIASDGID
jgi:ubiquitin carboxyl-terminal hydrolase L5